MTQARTSSLRKTHGSAFSAAESGTITENTRSDLTTGDRSTEQQRLDAIASCERLEQILAAQQIALQNIHRIFDNVTNGRDLKDGVVSFERSAQ
jgi:hypothetical protein